MSAQGWKPGSRLGARDAAHADMLTAGSASHIRVTIKDDTLGLGARGGRDPLGEPTGLDAFKGLLGRLNGKTDVELKQEQRKRDDVKLARYVSMKFQEVRFVSGGLLAQEKNDEIPTSTPNEASKSSTSPTQAEPTSNDSTDPASKSSKSSKSSKFSKPSKSSKSSKSSKKSRSRVDEADGSTSVTEPKKKKKSKKRKADAEEGDSSEENVDAIVPPPVLTTVKERRPIGRHVFRSRHIAQKKKALMDDKSLNEVRFPVSNRQKDRMLTIKPDFYGESIDIEIGRLDTCERLVSLAGQVYTGRPRIEVNEYIWS
ncbi:hypothetical protein NUU61_000335 [Penicillium alfredii]|uniref:G-patch domain-containing protein n=1 Tax=Penicillium alfredii TaxID=1506179 RepID=A0A9W9G9L2_9EURO|nr:uncharacterized protein NUU61_000335 [Penicillium alfredii]KAJ5114576.1 hypothetical protein NUU61_000335 [Penicillium alfredii]